MGGSSKVGLDLSVELVPANLNLGGAPEPEPENQLCQPASLVEGFAINCTVDTDGRNFTVTAAGTGPTNGFVNDPNITFVLNDETVATEMDVDSITTLAGSGYLLGIAESSLAGDADGILVFPGTMSNDGQIVRFSDFFVLASGLNIPENATAHVELDGETEVMSYTLFYDGEDKETGVVTTLAGISTKTLTFISGGFPVDSINEVVDCTVNYGSEEFKASTSEGAKRHCEL